MLNRIDFFALLFFQIVVTLALSEVMQQRNCGSCDMSADTQIVSDQWVLVDH